jgi:hypothetical protein
VTDTGEQSIRRAPARMLPACWNLASDKGHR